MQTTPLKWDSWSQSISTVILLWYQSQSGNIFIVAGCRCSKYTGTLAQSYNWARPHSCLEPLRVSALDQRHLQFHFLFFFFLKSNMDTANEPENLFFTLSALPQTKRWKRHVTSKVRLITVVWQTGRTPTLYHYNLWFPLKINCGDCSAGNPLHSPSKPIHAARSSRKKKKDPLTCCTFTYWSRFPRPINMPSAQRW